MEEERVGGGRQRGGMWRGLGGKDRGETSVGM